MGQLLWVSVILALFTGVTCRSDFPRECQRSRFGFDYLGTQSSTVQGLACQAWSRQYPHSHDFTTARYFPDHSIEETSNFCRNPDESKTGLWCYTTNSTVERDDCVVPKCSDYPECRLTTEGEEYQGNISTSASGRPCVAWEDAQSEQSAHSMGLLRKEASCRNPDGKPGGPWCYVSTEDEELEWEYCDVPFCKPSMPCMRSPLGTEFAGTISRTREGLPCQRWDRQAPHGHSYDDPSQFPDQTIADAANYCRNPGEPTIGGPWCYTEDPDVRWGYCDIPKCSDCRVSEVGETYSGSVATTETGGTCQRWSRQWPHTHNMTDPDRFPDADVEAAENFCRNPDRRSTGTWCYTTDADVEWETCDFPLCSEIPTGSAQRMPLTRHVLHIGVDGLKPSCFPDAPGGAPNIMKRLKENGAWTLERGRTVLETWSMPAWYATFCGMSLEQMGLTSNTWLPPFLADYSADITPVTGLNIPFPCLFDELKGHDINTRTAFFHSWWNFQYASNRGHPSMVDKDWYYDYKTRGSHVADQYSRGNGTEYLRHTLKSSESSYTFVYLTETDVAGHTWTWCSDQYLAAVASADKNVGLLLDLLEELGVEDDVLVVLSTDHGGDGLHHGDQADHDILVPIFLRGPGIKKDHEFRNDVSVVDIAPTVMYAMGLNSSPWWSGNIMEEAFERRNTY